MLKLSHFHLALGVEDNGVFGIFHLHKFSLNTYEKQSHHFYALLTWDQGTPQKCSSGGCAYNPIKRLYISKLSVLNQTGAQYLLEFSPPRISPLLWLDQNLNNTITRLSWNFRNWICSIFFICIKTKQVLSFFENPLTYN